MLTLFLAQPQLFERAIFPRSPITTTWRVAGGPENLTDKDGYSNIAAVVRPILGLCREAQIATQPICWGRRMCRTYGASDFLWGMQPSAYALG